MGFFDIFKKKKAEESNEVVATPEVATEVAAEAAATEATATE